ncbi:MAG: DNA repair protein RadC [Chloroflexi bacterium]|nr:DNA repair protein RadC [Chloroflexota bacterium]
MIRDLPRAERPRERLRDAGPPSLSNAELLAILLRTGTTSENVLNLATRLLASFDGLTGLAKAGFQELCGFHGLGEAKVAQIMAALELGKRLVSLPSEERLPIRSPQDVANLLMADMALLDQESLRLLLLNTKNQVLGTVEVYRGTVNSAVIRAGEVLRSAVRENCPAVILVHNHPSGDPVPSPEDVRTTQQLVEAGKLLDIEVLDHVVIGRQSFVSMKQKGLGF